jgi:hypothetical protein
VENIPIVNYIHVDPIIVDLKKYSRAELIPTFIVFEDQDTSSLMPHVFI